MSRAAIIQAQPVYPIYQFSDADRNGKRLVLALDETGAELARDTIDPQNRWQREKFLEAVCRSLPLVIDHQEHELSIPAIQLPHFLECFDSLESSSIKRSVLSMSDIHTEQIRWLWEQWLPANQAAFDGDPGVGKSLIALDIGARYTRGLPMPPAYSAFGPTTAPGNVMILTAEDSLSKTVKPRLEAAGADLNRVFAFDHVTKNGMEDLPRFPSCIDLLEAEIADKHIGYVIVDVLSAFTDPGLSLYVDSDTRRITSAFSRICDQHNCALLWLRHLNKNSGQSAKMRGGGSMSLLGAARIGWLAGTDPETGGNVLAVTKSNLAQIPSSIRYSIEESDSGYPVIAWGEFCDLRADDILPGQQRKDTKQTKGEECADLIQDTIGGGEIEAKELENICSQAGFSRRAYTEGRKLAHCTTRKEGFGSDQIWYVSLNGHCDTQPLESHFGD